MAGPATPYTVGAGSAGGMASAPANVPRNSWGIYTQDGAKLFDVDSVVDIKYENANKVSNFPVERGSFGSYNKVKTPYKVKLRMSVGGDQTRMSNFIAALDRVVNDTNLYTVVTPEAVYLNANLERVSYPRGRDKGANLIMADVEVIEIRQVEPQYAQVSLPPAKVKKADSASKKDTGKKQTEAPPPDLANVDAKTAFLQGLRGQIGGA